MTTKSANPRNQFNGTLVETITAATDKLDSDSFDALFFEVEISGRCLAELVKVVMSLIIVQ